MNYKAGATRLRAMSYLSSVNRLMGKKTGQGGLTHAKFLSLHRDHERAAAAAELIYLKDDVPGIIRRPAGRKFSYFLKGRPVRNRGALERIRKLAIPPAWKSVWICPVPSGHIQATGIDARGRKQYRYHSQWHQVRHETKFHRLYEFGKALPRMRRQLEKDLLLRGLPGRKVLAAVILLMERTYIRIGNEGYERMNGSYGLTTLKDRHLRLAGSEMNFSFRGKKGVFHKISLQNQRLARIVKECRDIPGEELFQYYLPDGTRRDVDSGQVNAYLKKVSGGDFSAKDFRLWAGSLNILRSFNSIGMAATRTACRQNILLALDQVSSKLGNTRTVCRKYYVHPGLIRLYEENNLAEHLRQLNATEKLSSRSQYTTDEKVLMKILRTFH
jgi:DNA topoisomerase-1